MQEIFVLKGYQMKYGKFLDLINFGRKRTVFIETLVYALNIIFYGYWNVTTKITSRETLSLN